MSWSRLRTSPSKLRDVSHIAWATQSPTHCASLGSAPSRPLHPQHATSRSFQTRWLSTSAESVAQSSQAEASIDGKGTTSRVRKVKSGLRNSEGDEQRPIPGEKKKDWNATRRAHRGGPTSVSQEESAILLHYEEPDQPERLSKLWLRDACGCPSCVNPSSGQKTFATTDVPFLPKVDAFSLAPNGDLQVTWAEDFRDGQTHVSVYTRKLLNDYYAVFRHPVLSVAKKPWNKVDMETSRKSITYSDWMSGGEAFFRAFVDLRRFGIVFLRDVPQTELAVEDIAKQIGHLQSTFYGMTWDVISKPEAENVAYTNVFLGLHHDLMYWRDPPKIQILHCLENSCEGGDSIFSDGLASAVKIQKTNQEFFQALEKTLVPYHYNIAPHYYRQYRPVIKAGPQGQIRDIFWSPPFQAPFFKMNPMTSARERNIPVQELWHKAASAFKADIEAPENVFEYKMQPGDCVLFDNRRVFHGRRAFNTSIGKRWLKGGYVSEEVFDCKAIALSEGLKKGDERLTYVGQGISGTTSW